MLKYLILAMISGTFLSACGGGSLDGNTKGEAANANNSKWVQGVFEDADKFSGACESDKIGSKLDEKLWLRSWSNDTYLWYNEINDQDPEYFSVSDYFDVLKTDALTASGTAKDKFHFSMSTQEWQLLSQSGASVSFGLNFVLQQKSTDLNIPRKVTVTYIDPNSSAAQANINRGSVVTKIDGIDVALADDTSSIDVLNNGLFPEQVGQNTVFTIESFDGLTTQEITLTAANVISTPVQHVNTFSTPKGNVGYLQFNSHIATAEKALFDAFTQLASEQVEDLVLDLRYNGGGLLDMASQLGYMIAGDLTVGKTFENLIFNDKHTVRDPVTGRVLTPSPFHQSTIGFNTGLLAAGQKLPSLQLERVFVLTTQDTCSASESLINGLRGIGVEVIQIGDTTCGKPYGFYPTDNCGTTYFTIQFKGENEMAYGDYADGFKPSEAPSLASDVQGCMVEDDFSQALGNENEAMLAAALSYSQSDVPICPEVTIAAKQQAQRRLTPELISQGFIIEDKRAINQIRNNRIMLPPSSY